MKADPRVFLTWARAYCTAVDLATIEHRRYLVLRDRKLPIWFVTPKDRP